MQVEQPKTKNSIVRNVTRNKPDEIQSNLARDTPRSTKSVKRLLTMVSFHKSSILIIYSNV